MTELHDQDRIGEETTLADTAEKCDHGENEACDICVPCDICREGPQECDCEGVEDCDVCYGSGYRVPDHCCGCGGSPYCVRCHRCNAPCFGECRCPVTVQLEGGRSLVL